MVSSLHDVTVARLPLDALPAVAARRAAPGVRVALAGEYAWLRWEPGDEETLHAVLPIRGVELYTFRQGRWYRLGQHLPSFRMPDESAFQGLSQVLFPSPFEALAAPGESSIGPAANLLLAADNCPRPASALICLLADLSRWADSVPSGYLATLRAARRGDEALVLGERLPPLAEGRRFWGQRILVPLGLRPEPEWPETALYEIFQLEQHQYVLLDERGAEVVAAELLEPLTRAGLRLAAREAP